MVPDPLRVSRISVSPGANVPGCRQEGSARLEEAFRELLFAAMTDSERASVRSQGGPGGSLRAPRAPSHGWIPISSARCSSAVSVPLASVQADMPVWPSTRLSWPPPRSVRQGGGCWGGEAWLSRVLPPGFAAKEEQEW